MSELFIVGAVIGYLLAATFDSVRTRKRHEKSLATYVALRKHIDDVEDRSKRNARLIEGLYQNTEGKRRGNP